MTLAERLKVNAESDRQVETVMKFPGMNLLQPY